MKKKILILDDKETIAKILHIYLMSEYDCIWLSDGLQAHAQIYIYNHQAGKWSERHGVD